MTLFLMGCSANNSNIAVGSTYLEQRKLLANNFELNLIEQFNSFKALKGEPVRQVVSVNNKLDEQPTNKYKKYNPFDPQVQRLGY